MKHANPLPADATPTAQEIFTKVATHLLDPNTVQSRNPETGVCAYRGEFGAKCAVGVVMPDEVYDPLMDQQSLDLDELIVHFPDRIPDWMKQNVGLLSRLQDAHDEVDNWHYSRVGMRQDLERIADDFGLEMPS